MFKKLTLIIAIIIVAIIALIPISSFLLEALGGSEGMSIVAEKLGVSEERVYEAPFHDYSFPGLGESVAANIASGILGVFIVVVLTLALASALKRRVFWFSRGA